MNRSHFLGRSMALALGICLTAFAACNGKPGGQGPGGSMEPARNAAPAHKNRRIVFVFKVDGLLYGEACRKGAQQATERLKGVSVEYLAPDKAEVGKQIDIVDQLIAEKADAIVISPNDDKAIEPVIKKAMAAGVKVFTWDSDAPGSERIFYVAAADDVEIGVEIAEKLAQELNGQGKVQIVSGGRAANNLNLHVEGFEKGFQKYPGITLIKPYIYNDDDNAKARSMAVAALQKNPDIAGFACANSPSPPAVGEAITRQGKIGQVKVWGLALPKETAPYLKSGAVSGVILWDPAKLTLATAILVNDYLDGKQPEDGAEIADVGAISYKNGVVLTGTTVFTKENVDQFDF